MARRATSLGPKPSLFYFFCFFFFSFLSLLLIDKKPCFPPRKGHFCLFLSVSLSFSLAFFGLPLFQFLFLCLSLVLFFLFSFLSFFFAFFLFLVFLSFFPFLSSLLLFHERNNIKTLNCNFFSSIFFFFWFPVLFFLSNPFFLSLLFFLILSYVFCSTSMFLVEKIKVEKNTNFWSKGGLQQNVFFYEPVFCKMWKVIVFFFCPFFWPILVDVQKHYENRYFSTFLKAKKKKYHFEVLLSGPSRCYYLGQVDCNPINTHFHEIMAANPRFAKPQFRGCWSEGMFEIICCRLGIKGPHCRIPHIGLCPCHAFQSWTLVPLLALTHWWRDKP